MWRYIFIFHSIKIFVVGAATNMDTKVLHPMRKTPEMPPWTYIRDLLFLYLCISPLLVFLWKWFQFSVKRISVFGWIRYGEHNRKCTKECWQRHWEYKNWCNRIVILTHYLPVVHDSSLGIHIIPLFLSLASKLP